MTTKRCTCGSFSFGTYGPDGSAESFEDYGTACNQTTKNVFAQGHDAKLVGYLVRAELATEEIALVDGGMRVTFAGAVEAARYVSDALALKAEFQLAAANARAAKKESRAANKKARAAKKAVEVAETPKDREATIKVGRWTYDATINSTGVATYTKKSGAKVVAARGEYSEV